MITNKIGLESFNEILEHLRSNKYSLILDESTDVSVVKQLALVVRTIDNKKERVRDLFLHLIDVKDSTAEGIYNSLVEFFTKHNIPFANMIGYAADNAAVMMGNISGLKKKLEDKVPNLFVLGCICHSLHLCSSNACLKLPRSIEDFCRDLYNYIFHSPKRILQFKEMQKFAALEPHRLLHPSQTRWLSLQAVVERILEQWPALVLFFQAVALEDHIQSASTILSALSDPIYKLYFSFLSYILPIVNKINLEFQSESVRIHVLYENLARYYKTILGNFVKREVILSSSDVFTLDCTDPLSQLDESQLYFGSKVEVIKRDASIPDEELHIFSKRCLEFYIELCCQMQKRFSSFSEIVPLLTLCNPTVACGNAEADLLPLLRKFPNLVDITDYDSIIDEWRTLPLFYNHQNLSKDPMEFWFKVRKEKSADGNQVYPLISKFMISLLIIPHSSAAVERVFSRVSLIKTRKRNRLGTDTMNGLLLTKQHGGNISCFDWEPAVSMLSYSIPEETQASSHNVSSDEDL